MPTYEYACKNCSGHLEVVQKFSDDPLTECPSCGGELRKVFGAIGIAFKGTGFYKTDSRAAAKPAGDKVDQKVSSKDDGKSAASTDSGSNSGGSETSSTSTDTSSKPESKPSSGESSKGDKTA